MNDVKQAYNPDKYVKYMAAIWRLYEAVKVAEETVKPSILERVPPSLLTANHSFASTEAVTHNAEGSKIPR